MQRRGAAELPAATGLCAEPLPLAADGAPPGVRLKWQTAAGGGAAAAACTYRATVRLQVGSVGKG